jgi:hypothetical protein
LPHSPIDTAQSPQNANTEIARCFQRLANLDNGAFERLGRYETALWRPVDRIIFMLNSCGAKKAARSGVPSGKFG